ncbi:MAG: bifunctional adenosylcobinamide kinase/adenosylcobinamide-phosphate guanylyltransferase [Butyrivibrio sp.]|nr:bifunctional adenosylcobinamide kinase/adenosylcobinamide-phosphate guanylyltransferase [Butyrivibrio sp.]
MIFLVIGTMNSGKSAFAEDLVMKTEGKTKYYLATMKICDEAGKERVNKHRKMREGKGFITIEKELDLAGAGSEMESPGEAVVLLECVSNLVGNEMHKDSETLKKVMTDPGQKEALAEKIAADTRTLSEKVKDLVMVTNEYEHDDPGYDEETIAYIELLSNVNEKLRGFSDKVFDIR